MIGAMHLILEALLAWYLGRLAWKSFQNWRHERAARKMFAPGAGLIPRK